jgi:hypothetical protein
LTAVLMVMSGMDPHMIRWNPRLGVGLVWLVSPSRSCWLGRSSTMDFVVWPMSRFEVWSLLRCLEAFGIVITTAFYESNLVSHSLLSHHIMFFPHLLSSKHKSTHPCLPHCFRWSGRLEPRVSAGWRWRVLGGLSNDQAYSSYATLSYPLFASL